MDGKFKRPKGRNGVSLALNVAIDALDVAGDLSSSVSAKTVCRFVSALITTTKLRYCVHLIACWLTEHRTRWPTECIMSSWGWPALTFVGYLTKGRRADRQMDSVNQYSGQSQNWKSKLNQGRCALPPACLPCLLL